MARRDTRTHVKFKIGTGNNSVTLQRNFMKKLTLIIVLATSASCMYGMDNTKTMYKNETEQLNDNSNNNNNNTNNKIFQKIDQRIPNSIGMLSCLMNFAIGGGTEYFKANTYTRAGFFLFTNVLLGLWYNKNYNEYKEQKDKSTLAKDAAIWQPYSLKSQLLGGFFGGLAGTGIVKGIMKLEVFLTERNLRKTQLQAENLKAYLNYLKK